MVSAKILLYLIIRVSQIILTESAWQSPYFLETNTDGVSFQTAVGVQKINVREELSWPFQLLKINYQGSGTPTLGSFDIGDNSLLGAKITAENDDWIVTIEKRQDFENSNQRIYAFQIYIKDDADELMEHGILLTLENIFDNKPSVTYNPSPCRVEELQTNFITNCIFTIYDADGMDRNILRIQVNGQYNEADIFDFEDFGETRTYEKEYKLRIKKPLHYEERAVYNLDVSVHDTSNNTGNIFAILEVIDLPNRDPIWVRPLTTATFDEKQEQFFTLNAIDGDTGINKPICYRLEFEEDYSELMSINETTGVLHVVPIDRDILQQQIFNFYTCAYKCDNSSWFIKNTTILIVQDINDHIPEIIMEPNLVQILEQKYLTLPMDKFIIEDIDLGINATYKAYLMTTNGISYSEAFSLVPNSGYQQTNFSLTVLKADQLDYETEEWRNFDIMICAEEVENSARRSNRTLRIELINWNDEWPIFMFDSYEVNIMENVTKGTFLKQIYARDRDFGDRVNHSIVGNMSGLEINTQAGVIFTSHDNVFDYERQTTVLVQIQAKDTLITEHSKTLHTVFAQLTINIIDVNDETPQLRMPRAIVNITENAAPSTLLTDKIEVRDADTTANLTLEILWNATYATKSGQEVQSELFINSLLIESEAESKNVLNGLLRVNPAFEAQVDYEKYDTIFLTIRARDLNQEINEDTVIAVLTIRVDDANDNPPNFRSGTLEEPRKVTEMETISTVIGSIEAFDIDGPGNNNFTFDLRSIGNLTENYLISINNETGVLRVNGSIQCDVPRIFLLEYEIILNDGVYTTIGKINISIIDINNRVPEKDAFEQQVKIYENATTGEIVGQIKAFDRDRDFPHNALEFSISSAISDIHNLFEINATTGIVKVNLRNGLHLDRDNGITYHYIPVDVKDNFNFNNRGYGPVNQISTFLNISLLDVNDNAPIMPAKFLFSPEFSESDTKDTLSKIQLIAEDKDEYNTSNSWLSYKILDIRPVGDNANNLIGYEDLFGIIGDNRTYGQLTSLKPLKGFYGIWQIEIEAFDHGTPTLRNASKYEILVRPYNFHAPTIIFPVLHKTIRLCHSLQEPNRPLFQADCVSRLPHFEAFDPDGGEYGDINFLLSSDVGHDKYFQLSKNSRNQSSLYLQELVPAGIYYLNIRATDGGGSSSEDIRNLKIVFVDMLGNPMFLEREFYTNFTENDDGLTEERLIPEAFDPKNEGLNLDEEPYKLYYFIDETFMPENAELFQLNKETRVLKLAQMLDREAIEIYRLRIKVTNNENGLISNPNSVNYTMDIIININDVNDNPPRFAQGFYAAGITTKDSINKDVLKVHADDRDLNDTIFYLIDEATFQLHGENLPANSSQFFILNIETGEILLNSYVTNNMKGYFMFDIVARDSAIPPHYDIASVKIYIVSEANRVKFVFLSEILAIRENEQFIKEEFQQIYGYEICNIDSVEDTTNQKGIIKRRDGAFITDVMMHFIHNNEAVDAVEIQKRSTDLAFLSKIQNILQRRNLILNDVPHLTVNDVTPMVDDWLLTALILAIIIFATLSAVLVIVIIYKIRSYKRQLKAFEPPEFSSIASNLNRIGAPTSNIFSVEGSNPVINKQNNNYPKFGVYEESASSDSEDGEDEFIGLQDDPTFEMNNMKNLEHEKPQTFEHKILNNEFFNIEPTKGHSCEEEKNLRY